MIINGSERHALMKCEGQGEKVCDEVLKCRVDNGKSVGSVVWE